MNFLLIFLLAITPCIPLIEGANATHYTAAVVEYYPYIANVTANAINYVKFIEDAAYKAADIIVFPESSLNGRGPHQEDTKTAIPDPSLNIAPCGSNDPKYNAPLKMISCSAQKNNIYVVLNLVEYSEEAHNVTVKYNTNVVFGRNGVVIARYRKVNLYGERGITAHKSVPTYFDTDFGVRFGTFICFDILYDKPPLQLTRELGIKHIVFTAAWHAELPFYVANQYYQAWAYDLDVAMLAAGYNDPENGAGGSGIFLGRAGPIYSKIPDTPGSIMYIASVPYTWNATNGQEMAVADVKIIAQETPQAKVIEGGLMKLMRQDMLQFESVLIEGKELNRTLCYEDFCCDFVAVAEGKLGGGHSYRAMVFNGVRLFTGSNSTAGFQACSIVSCEDNTLASCGARIDSRLTFTVLSISGNFSNVNSHITPSTLHYNQGLTSLLPSHITFKNNCTNETCSTKLQSTGHINNLLTFGIASRLFSRDGEELTPPRLSPNAKNRAPVFQTSLLWTSAVVFLLYNNL